MHIYRMAIRALDYYCVNDYHKTMKKNPEKAIFELQAETCKTLANPKRLEILNILKEGELTVTEIVDRLNVPKANVSQHLAVMRHKGIVSTRREGVNIYYSVANSKVIQACILMREVLVEQMSERKKLIERVNQKQPVEIKV